MVNEEKNISKKKKPKGHADQTIVYNILKPFAVAAGKISKNIEKTLENAREKLREYGVVEQDAEKRDYDYEVEYVSKHVDDLPNRFHHHLKLYGGSIVKNYQKPILNAHIHTDKPDTVLNYFMSNISQRTESIEIANLNDQIAHQEWIYKAAAIPLELNFARKVVKFVGKDVIGISLNDLFEFYNQPKKKEIPMAVASKIIDSKKEKEVGISSSDISSYINEMMHARP